jgi:hypothetical protein
MVTMTVAALCISLTTDGDVSAPHVLNQLFMWPIFQCDEQYERLVDPRRYRSPFVPRNFNHRTTCTQKAVQNCALYRAPLACGHKATCAMRYGVRRQAVLVQSRPSSIAKKVKTLRFDFPRFCPLAAGSSYPISYCVEKSTRGVGGSRCHLGTRNSNQARCLSIDLVNAVAESNHIAARGFGGRAGRVLGKLCLIGP